MSSRLSKGAVIPLVDSSSLVMIMGRLDEDVPTELGGIVKSDGEDGVSRGEVGTCTIMWVGWGDGGESADDSDRLEGLE